MNENETDGLARASPPANVTDTHASKLTGVSRATKRLFQHAILALVAFILAAIAWAVWCLRDHHGNLAFSTSGFFVAVFFFLVTTLALIFLVIDSIYVLLRYRTGFPYLCAGLVASLLLPMLIWLTR